MSDKPLQSDAELDAEARVFARYLAECEADAYVCGKYREAHEVPGLIENATGSAFDSFVLGVARRGPLGTRLADVYTRRFFRRSVVRRKLLLTLAILECARCSFARFEAGGSRGSAVFWLGMPFKALAFAVSLVISVVFFSLARGVIACLPGPARNGRVVEPWVES